MNRAIFLDRDGTLNVDRNYLSNPKQLELIPGTGAALRRLMDAGFLLFIVTNQSGIGRGYYTLSDMHAVNDRLCAELAKDQVRFEKIYFAAESPEQPSRGRKPSPQFLLDARDEFSLDLSKSYMVGDKLIDLECGQNAGVRQSILVRTGYGGEVEKQLRKLKFPLKDVQILPDVAGASHWIIEDASEVKTPSPGGLGLQS